VTINRIERLTPEEFVERPIKQLAPAAGGPYPHGLHTLSAAGNVTLVDGKRHASSAAPLTIFMQRFSQRLIRRVGGTRDTA
jgi:hypothetical protein